MGKLFSAIGVAGGLLAGACNTCFPGGAPATSRPHTVANASSVGDALEGGSEAKGPFSLPKHDWNGLRVLMTEGQARAALKKIGLAALPARGGTFLTYDVKQRVMHLWKGDGKVPSMVVLEAERKERILKNVWGVRLVFIKNRLFQFSPQYFTSPVEIVEPDDEYITAEEMEKKLIATFGHPNLLNERIDVVKDDGTTVKEHVLIWEDAILGVVFRRPEKPAIGNYLLIFASPEAMRKVKKHLDASLKSTKKVGSSSPWILKAWIK